MAREELLSEYAGLDHVIRRVGLIQRMCEREKEADLQQAQSISTLFFLHPTQENSKACSHQSERDTRQRNRGDPS